jgi:hypothetical protein
MARPAPIGASWFETALTRLLTMRVRERRLEGWAAKRLPTRICILAARFARVLLTPPPSESRGRREGRVAACTRVSRKEELREREKPQVQAVITPAFPARWFTAYTCSSVNHSVCHRRLRKACQLSVLLGLERQTSVRQDHTTSPYADAPLISRHPHVHRIPHHVRDDAYAPLIGAERQRHTVNQKFRK